MIHPTAILEAGVSVGASTSVWDNVHIRGDTIIGEECIVGEKSHISYNVRIGNRVKINAFVYICTAVTIEDGVMISAGCVFTNDRYPRAASADLLTLRDSSPDEHTLPTVIRCGATLGAGCIIGPGLEVGRFAMIGMGSVVTRSIGDFQLVYGHPAKLVGWVCRCGKLLATLSEMHVPPEGQSCVACGRSYQWTSGQDLNEMTAVGIPAGR